jgi:hypothetical protein
MRGQRRAESVHLARRVAPALAFWLLFGASAGTQQHETIAADFTFYGDNTEFANPFREGETLLGVFGRIVLDVEVNDRLALQGGVFGNQRFGSARAFEQVRPVFTLIVRGSKHRFLFGTLGPQHAAVPSGPDRQTLHALLPPLQSETLALVRPWEAGLQWLVSPNRMSQDAWINWQLLNTERQRERFDAGVVGDARLGGPVWLGYQWHLVHRGGQQFAVGPVADSQAIALGPRLTGALAGVQASLEAWGLLSRDVPDREQPPRSRTGQALLVRAAGERHGWRGHVLVFRGFDFVKAEGDPNYQAVRRDGTPFRRVRDYAEAGVARRFELAPRAVLDAAVRVHRVESHYEYSYRIIARVGLAWPIR